MTLENKGTCGDAVSKSRTISQEVVWKESYGFDGCFPDDKFKGSDRQVHPPAVVVHETLLRKQGMVADEKGEKPPDPATKLIIPKIGPNVSVEGEATLVKPQWYQELICEKSQDYNGLVPTQQVSDNPATIDRRLWRSAEDISKADEAKDFNARVLYHEQLPSPSFRRRKRQQSMFEIQPRNSATEVVEIQEFRIEQGVVQAVRESATTLPDLAGTSKAFDARNTSTHEDHSRQQVTDATTWLPSHVLPGTQTRDVPKPSVHPCSSTTHRAPHDRRRSLGFLTTPTWAVMTYRDHDADQSAPRSPRARRPSSAVSRDSQQNNTITNSSEEHQRIMSKSWKEPIAIRENRLHENDQPENTGAANAVEKTSEDEAEATNADEEVDEFRPRLRSRSLEDFRFAAREKVLEARERHEKRKERRRKSFDVWLSDKEKEAIEKMNVLALEKRREAAEEAGKRQNRKGKSYGEWLREKGGRGEVAKKQTEPAARGNETKNETHGRQRVARTRYEKWLCDKEMEAMEKEKSLLKKAERKTIEMRKKYEDKEKMRTNGLKYSTGPVCG